MEVVSGRPCGSPSTGWKLSERTGAENELPVKRLHRAPALFTDLPQVPAIDDST
jgi:hypothetical protein